MKDDGTVENFAVRDGFHVTDTEHNELAEGNVFVSGYIFEGVASNGSAVAHIKTGAKIIVMSYGVGADGSMDYTVYKNPTITNDGTELLGVNRNMVTVKTPTCKVFRTPTVSSNGTLLIPRTNGGAVGPAKGGGAATESRVIIVPPNTSLLIVATNKATGAERINIVVDWIERAVV